MIKITFTDGEVIKVNSDSTFIGINNSPPKNENEPFYLTQEYNDLLEEISRISTTDPRLGVAGFILSFDCFAFGEGVDQTIYMSSAVKSISVV